MGKTFLIREARRSDAAALLELAQRTYTVAFGHSFSDADLAFHLETHLSPDNVARFIDEDVVLLAEVERQMVGYVQFGVTRPLSEQPANREIRRLYVDPAFQNAGYGGALLEAALRHPMLTHAAGVFLEVWEHNHRAQRFYRRFGFEVVGTRVFEKTSGVSDSVELIMVRRQSPARWTDREVAGAVGRVCDGGSIPAEDRAAVQAALTGAVQTERGLRLYYADMDTMLLPNVDTDEGIWSTDADGIVRGGSDEALVDLHDDAAAMTHGLFPLSVVRNPVRRAVWESAMTRASNADRQRWARFVRRVLRPLVQRESRWE